MSDKCTSYFIRMTCLTCMGTKPVVTVLLSGKMIPPKEKPVCPACLGKGFHLISDREYYELVKIDSKRGPYTERGPVLLNQ